MGTSVNGVKRAHMFIKLSGHDVDGVKRAHKLTTQSGQIFWCDMRKVGAHVKESGQNC